MSAPLATAGLPAALSSMTYAATLGGPEHADMYPSGVEVAPTGELVVADTGNQRVSKYRPDGTRVWTTGTHGSGVKQFSDPRDIGIDSLGSIYVADTRNSRIVKLGPRGAWISSWTGPEGDPMSFPLGLSVSGDKVYVADSGFNKIRVFDTSGNQLSELVSAPGCELSKPRDVDADPAGNLYVANYTANNILKLSPSGACLLAWGSVGTAAGQFRTPYGVRLARDPVLGKVAVYVADANNDRIQEFTTYGKFVAVIGGPGDAGVAGTFFQLRRVAVAANGDVWGADVWGFRIERFARTRSGYTFARSIGAPLPPPTDTSVFEEPHGIAFEPDGTVDVVDTVHHRVVRMTQAGHIVGVCGMRGSIPGDFNWPRGVAVDDATGDLWVADTKQYRVQVIRPDCSFVAMFGKLGSGPSNFNWPYSIVIRQSDRTAWIADTNNNRVKVYDVVTRRLISTFGTAGSGDGQFLTPGGVAVDPANGHILVADTGNDRIVELSDTAGLGIAVVGTYTGVFSSPEGVAADSTGRIYVADSGGSAVVQLAPGGQMLSLIGDAGAFDTPESLAVGPDDRLYVADTYHDRVQVYSTAG